MFAVVANGIQAICKTQRELDAILALYPYPKFQKCASRDDALKWLLMNKRDCDSLEITHYGNISKWGYLSIEYFITPNDIRYNLDMSRVGYIRVCPDDDTTVNVQGNIARIVVKNIQLDNDLIAHHCLAIRRIVKIIGQYVDLDIHVPDISVYLAITKYSGKHFVIKGLQKDLSLRCGGYGVTVDSY